MREKKINISNVIFHIIIVIIISIFAYSLTPKTFQNDTFYTIKIGEHIVNETDKLSDLLPWNKGLDMQDPFSWHKGLPYTYPHWLYDLITYKIYTISGFDSIYWATCILAIILGISIYFINIKFNKNIIISFLVTICSLYCLESFIAARAQLVTFILFVFTIFNIEQFLKTKKVIYAVSLIVISTLIANLHCAVWPFFFILFLPYITEYIIYKIISINYLLLSKKIELEIRKINKKIDKNEYINQKNKLNELIKKHKQNIPKKLKSANKLELVENPAIKWLLLICIICAFTGLLTPIKDTPYTYLIRTTEGNTTQNINEHLPLTLVKNKNMILILVIVFGILTFTKVKISVKDFFMLFGLITLTFMSQRQISMLIIIGNFIIAKMICQLYNNLKDSTHMLDNVTNKSKLAVKVVIISGISVLMILISFDKYLDKKNTPYVNEKEYPVAASQYINETLIPKVGIENLKLYNDYNYGSYLLFQGIPVFIDSRADLYTPEFYGEKDENGEYIGNDIFTDYLNISSLASSYEYEFERYGVTHVMTGANSKLNSIICKDVNYDLLYSDEYFVIYEKENNDE